MITWFTGWLARFVAFAGQLAAKLVTGIVAALASPFAKKPSKEDT